MVARLLILESRTTKVCPHYTGLISTREILLGWFKVWPYIYLRHSVKGARIGTNALKKTIEVCNILC